MSNIEELVRQSLHQRAEDVEPTPELWQQVDRRVTARRRWRVTAWSLAGAAAVAIAGLVVVPAVVDGADPAPEIEPLPPGPEEAPEPEPGDDAGEPDDEARDDDTGSGADTAETLDPEPGPEGADGAVVDGVTLPEPVLVASFRTIDLIGPEGRETLAELQPEGESWIHGLTVRPGSTPHDLTAVVLSSAEGFWDLRHLEVVDGEVVTWDVLPERFRPRLSAEAVMGGSVTGPVFSPDGDALAWIEQTPDDVSLQVIGWDDGPGTGEPATDNAAFSLDAPLGGFELMDWVPAVAADDDATTHWLRLTSADAVASWHRVALQRQADGAWSVPASGAVSSVSEEGAAAGTMPALAGVDDGGAPVWLLNLRDDQLWLEHIERSGAGTTATSTELPPELVAGDGLPVLWLQPLGDGVLVGSPDTATAVYVAPSGETSEVTELAGRWAYAAPVR